MTGEKWRLARTKQCDKCPWKVSTDPYDIPHGYSREKHATLRSTIARPGTFGSNHVMSCHEHPPGKEVYCLGWLVHQLGPGNNIGLRLRMFYCENAKDIQLDGEQHQRFEDTLPKRRRRRYG
jgi:hypothetical protein